MKFSQLSGHVLKTKSYIEIATKSVQNIRKESSDSGDVLDIKTQDRAMKYGRMCPDV